MLDSHMSNKSQHVVRNPNGGWSVRSSGTSRAAKTFERQEDAVTYGRAVAMREGTDFYIHASDGRIRERNTYGRDPHPPKG